MHVLIIFYYVLVHPEVPLGVAQVPLADLADASDIHTSVQLNDTKKRNAPLDSRLELTIRIRKPLSGDKTTTVERSWMMLDATDAGPAPAAVAQHIDGILTNVDEAVAKADARAAVRDKGKERGRQ